MYHEIVQSLNLQLIVSKILKFLSIFLYLQQARGLVGREYMGGACDPYVKVIVWRERRSIRKVKSAPLHVFRTRTIRHNSAPEFNQSFVMDVTKSELKVFILY